MTGLGTKQSLQFNANKKGDMFKKLKRFAVGTTILLLYSVLVIGACIYWLAPIGVAFFAIFAALILLWFAGLVFPFFRKDFQWRFSGKSIMAGKTQDEFNAAFPHGSRLKKLDGENK